MAHLSLPSLQSPEYSPTMEISTQLSPRQGVSFGRSWTFPKNPPVKLNTISCRASTLESPRLTSNTNLYEVLSLESKSVSFDEIKKAYRNLARQYHPDVVDPSTREESTRMFVQVQKAYETLSNPISRHKYDLGASSEGRNSFDKDVWADQLSGLEFKSNEKKRRKQQRSAACV